MVDFFITLVKVIHIVSCILLMIAVLLQSGKGGGMGAAFGGATQTVFGGGGGSKFIVRLSAILAGTFIITSTSLAFFATRGYEQRLARRDAVLKAQETIKTIDNAEKNANNAKKLALKIEKHIDALKPPADKTEKTTLDIEGSRKEVRENDRLLENLVRQLRETRIETQAAEKKEDRGAVSEVVKKTKDLNEQVNTAKNNVEALAKKFGIAIETPTSRPETQPKSPSTQPDTRPTTGAATQPTPKDPASKPAVAPAPKPAEKPAVAPAPAPKPAEKPAVAPAPKPAEKPAVVVVEPIVAPLVGQAAVEKPTTKPIAIPTKTIPPTTTKPATTQPSTNN
jgi:preprotein translocase subunit SecG